MFSPGFDHLEMFEGVSVAKCSSDLVLYVAYTYPFIVNEEWSSIPLSPRVLVRTGDFYKVKSEFVANCFTMKRTVINFRDDNPPITNWRDAS